MALHWLCLAADNKQRGTQMLNPAIGDTLTRIVPPSGSSEGYSQSGKVIEVTDDTIVMAVQADVIRHMRFGRSDGFDTVGLGSFLVRPDWLQAPDEEGKGAQVGTGGGVTCYTGYLTHNGVRLQVDFEAPADASKGVLDAAFLQALGEKVEFDYLAIGTH
jgi:hypothetical protein